MFVACWALGARWVVWFGGTSPKINLLIEDAIVPTVRPCLSCRPRRSLGDRYHGGVAYLNPPPLFWIRADSAQDCHKKGYSRVTQSPEPLKWSRVRPFPTRRERQVAGKAAQVHEGCMSLSKEARTSLAECASDCLCSASEGAAQRLLVEAVTFAIGSAEKLLR